MQIQLLSMQLTIELGFQNISSLNNARLKIYQYPQTDKGDKQMVQIAHLPPLCSVNSTGIW